MNLLTQKCNSTKCPHFGHCLEMPIEEIPRDGVGISIVIVGQGAGWQEEEKGRPWIGEAGQLLRKSLSKAVKKFEPGGVAFGNSVRCRPFILENNRKKDRPPTLEEIDNCLIYVETYINSVNPRIVLLAGGSTSSIYGYSDIMAKERGKIKSWRPIKAEKSSSKILMMPIYHPAGVLRQRHLQPYLDKDLETAYEIAGREKEEENQLELFR